MVSELSIILQMPYDIAFPLKKNHKKCDLTICNIMTEQG